MCLFARFFFDETGCGPGPNLKSGRTETGDQSQSSEWGPDALATRTTRRDREGGEDGTPLVGSGEG